MNLEFNVHSVLCFFFKCLYLFVACFLLVISLFYIHFLFECLRFSFIIPPKKAVILYCIYKYYYSFLFSHSWSVGSVSRASASQPGGRGYRTPTASYKKTLKDGSCCYLVWRSTIRDRATSIWRCSVAAGLTINWSKRISVSV